MDGNRLSSTIIYWTKQEHGTFNVVYGDAHHYTLEIKHTEGDTHDMTCWWQCHKRISGFNFSELPSMYDTCKSADSKYFFGHEERQIIFLQSRKKLLDVQYPDHTFAWRSALEN